MKNEETLLAEAYGKIYQVDETVHDSDEPALGPDEERQSDGSVKNTKTGETVYTPKEQVTKEAQGRPFAASADILSHDQEDAEGRAEADEHDSRLADKHSNLLSVVVTLNADESDLIDPDFDNDTITVKTSDGDYILKLVGKVGDHDVPVSLR